MLKQDKETDEWVIDGPDDLEEVAAAIEERKEAIQECEEKMEEEYDYLTMKSEVESLTAAMTKFMTKYDVAHIFRATYKVTLIKRQKAVWNPEKLKALIPKGMWLKVTRMTIDPDKIDDLVRAGKLDSKKIAKAFETKPEKPYVRLYPYTEGQGKDAAIGEERALRAAMSGEAAAKSTSKRKKKS